MSIFLVGLFVLDKWIIPVLGNKSVPFVPLYFCILHELYDQILIHYLYGLTESYPIEILSKSRHFPLTHDL